MAPPLSPRDALERARIPSFDGVRALAILPVVFHHATPRPLEGVMGRGPLGVDLFFALSGFLITTLLCREKEATGTVRLGRFWARRALRIFPLYYAVLALFVVHAVLLRDPGPVRDHFLRSLPVHLTYTSNWLLDTNVPHSVVFGFGWSLATEEQFYLVWPLVMRAARRTGVAATFMLGVLAVDQLADRGHLGALLGAGVLLRALRSIAAPIVGGALLALALRSRAGLALLAPVLAHRAASLAALAALLFLAWTGGSLALAHLSMIALVGACALRADHLLAPLLEHPIARFIGDRSYAIYLLNVPAVVAVKRLLGEGSLALVFVLGFALSLAFAHAAHLLVERPLLAARARLR
ncbi:MAG: acyltransferase [Labilithrix sp.]|nr:acyltransferase [Labilithrix sp.]MCW5812462.1 acyltransferase [Labilithrix sp.]